MFVIRDYVSPGMVAEINVFRYVWLQVKLLVSRSTREELEAVQATYNYVVELLVRKEAKMALRSKIIVEQVEPVEIVVISGSAKELSTALTEDDVQVVREGAGMAVVEYDPDALDYLIQNEGKVLNDMLKKEGWA